MGRYLLSCSCGGQLVVEPGQAGETLRCDCGRQVAVPTLRQMRELPPAVDSSAAADRRRDDAASTWGARQGAVTVLVLLAIGSLIAIVASRWMQPTLPTFNPAGWTVLMDTKISELTPKDAWQAWIQFYQPLERDGFQEIEYHGMDAIKQQIAWHRGLQWTFAAIAAVSLIAAVTTAVVGRFR